MSTIDFEIAVLLFLTVKNFQPCTIAYQKGLEENPALLIRKVLQEEASSIDSYLNLQVHSQQRDANQRGIFV